VKPQLPKDLAITIQEEIAKGRATIDRGEAILDRVKVVAQGIETQVHAVLGEEGPNLPSPG
jgi:hypothetical protein